MVIIKQYEEILNGEREFNKDADNWTIYKVYCHSKTAGNDLLDFDELIRDDDIQAIADMVHNSGIKEFTVSYATGGLMNTLAAFEEVGIKVQGLVKVNSRYPASYGREENEIIPALLMKVL